MVTDTKPTTTERRSEERVLAPFQREKDEEAAFAATNAPVKSPSVSRGRQRLTGRIAHPLVAFHARLSGPPATSRQRKRAELAYAEHSRKPTGIIV